jgi:hypothetical protein
MSNFDFIYSGPKKRGNSWAFTRRLWAPRAPDESASALKRITAPPVLTVLGLVLTILTIALNVYTNRLTQRAYLSYTLRIENEDEIKKYIGTCRSWYVNYMVAITNNGNTPALHVRVNPKMLGHLVDPPLQKAVISQSGTIGPADFSITPKETTTVHESSNVKCGSAAPIGRGIIAPLTGVVEYADVFGSKHAQQYCGILSYFEGREFALVDCKSNER